MPTGISIHVGLNHLNEVHYKGRHSLAGCLRDAEAMHALARAAGFEAKLIIGDDATAQAVLDAIEEARPRVGSDGMLLLTYSGHGSRVLDRAEHGRAHDLFDYLDQWDESWCLYDRQLIDDELFACWAGFPEGARILVVSDSCFSGGMIRTRPKGGPRITRRTLWGSPVVLESSQAGESEAAGGTAAATAVPVRRTMRGGTVRGGGQRRRALSSSAYRAVYFRNHALYDDVQRAVHSTPPRPVVAEVILLSASGDQQTAADGDTNGAFTAALLEVWNGGAFQGSYLDLHRELRDRLVPGQHPQLIPLRTPSFLLQRPFTI